MSKDQWCSIDYSVYQITEIEDNPEVPTVALNIRVIRGYVRSFRVPPSQCFQGYGRSIMEVDRKLHEKYKFKVGQLLTEKTFVSRCDDVLEIPSSGEIGQEYIKSLQRLEAGTYPYEESLKLAPRKP